MENLNQSQSTSKRPQRFAINFDAGYLRQVVVYEPSQRSDMLFPFTLFPFAQPYIHLTRDRPFDIAEHHLRTFGYACGQLSRPVNLTMPAGSRTAVVIWHPLALNMLRAHLAPKTPSRFDLAPLSEGLTVQLKHALSAEHPQDALEEIASVIKRSSKSDWQPDHRLARSWHEILVRKGEVNLAEIATIAGVSERRVQQMFREQLGTTPKAFCQVVRFQNYLQKLVGSYYKSERSDSFFDDAHFIKDLRQRTGMTPQMFKRYLQLHEVGSDVILASPFSAVS